MSWLAIGRVHVKTIGSLDCGSYSVRQKEGWEAIEGHNQQISDTLEPKSQEESIKNNGIL